jgi:hypothetical protein
LVVWIASIKRSPTISMSFSMLLASRWLPEQREQRSRRHSHNGLTRHPP